MCIRDRKRRTKNEYKSVCSISGKRYPRVPGCAFPFLRETDVYKRQIEGEAKGYYHQTEKYIAIQEDMSNLQTMKTGVHEVSPVSYTHLDVYKRQL